MNLKTILMTSLLAVILLTTVWFGFLTYGVYTDSAQQVGKDLVSKHQLLFYVMAALHVVSFGLGTAVWYKA
ncbi:hypothetical protein JTE90_022613 [Oedothorax gibbosus]|uniref:Uncharacterized protein n=1 Tax=Oedothorax gibbosus TaxID=931172 RepID=A0AAV6TUQ3_9ARAC|nr:hypothetical protein JTE90_022613 [Oedothorax gibbosus]